MRIVHVVLTGGFAGTERYVLRLAAAQQSRGYEVGVVLRPGAAGTRAAFAGTLGSTRVTTLSRAWPKPLLVSGLHHATRRHRPEILQSHCAVSCILAAGLGHRLGLPHVSTLHSDYAEQSFGLADALVAIADWQLTAARSFKGPQQLIRNWVEPIPPEAGGGGIDPRRECGIEHDEFVFVAAGRFEPVKGFLDLIPAFREEFPAQERARLLLLGAGGQMAELQAAARGARITFAGWRDPALPWLQAADAYVSSAHWEGLSLSLLEAAAAGLPMALTQIAGNSTFAQFQAGQAIALCRPGDPASIRRALRAVYARGTRRIQYNLAPFSRETALDAYDEFYAGLACAGPRLARRPAMPWFRY